MRLLALGTYETDRHPRFGVLLDGLRSAGFQVVEVNAPLGLTTEDRVRMLQRPWRVGVLALRLIGCWLRLTSNSTRSRWRSRPDAVLVGYLGHFDVVLARLLFPRTPVVLDHLVFAADTAHDRGQTGNLKQRLLRALDALAIRCADLLVVDTEEHLRMLPEKRRTDGVVCPVGAPRAWFAAGRKAAMRRPRDTTDFVFFGLFTPLQGAVTIAEACAVLAHRTDIRLTMVGRGQDLPAAKTAAAQVSWITWVDWIDPDRLPGLVASHDVCLGIFGTGSKALRVVPNKVYQGAAAGCALITSETPPQRRVLQTDAVFVPAGDAAMLAAAMAELADAEARRSSLAVQAAGLARRSFTPAAVTAPLQSALIHITGSEETNG
jgi:glycosyltransferase involved in cell wall biosynthesis